jgi:hypothetical protein
MTRVVENTAMKKKPQSGVARFVQSDFQIIADPAMTGRQLIMATRLRVLRTKLAMIPEAMSQMKTEAPAPLRRSVDLNFVYCDCC